MTWAVIFDLDPEKNWYNEESILVFYRWINEKYGMRDMKISPATWRWNVQGTSPIRVYFRDANDAMMFKLTWL